MTTLQRLQLREREIRARLAELAAIDDQSEDQESEQGALIAEVGGMQQRMQAAEISEQETLSDATASDDGERAEFRHLVGSATIGGILQARMSGVPTAGAERELQQQYGQDSNIIPQALLGPTGERQERALTLTGDGSQAQQAPVMPVYPSPSIEFLNVGRQSVAPGVVSVPVLTVPAMGAAAVPESISGSTAVAPTAQSVSFTELKPTRHLSVTIDLQQEQRRTVPGVEGWLRQNISELITAGLDRDALVGDTVGLAVRGTDPSDPTAVMTWASLIAPLTGAVDGVYADRLSQVRLLMRHSTYALAETLYRSGETDRSGIEWLDMRSGGHMVSAFLTQATNFDQALLIRGSLPMSAQQYVWDGLEVTDPYTDARTRNIRITLAQFFAFGVFRPDVYIRHAYQVAS